MSIRVLVSLFTIALATLLVYASTAPGAAANQANLTLLAQFGGELGPVAVNGDRLYTATGSLLEIFDVSQPEKPSKLGDLRLPDSVNDIAIDSNYAFIAVDGLGLWIVDITEPSSPSIAGLNSTSFGAKSVYVASPFAYVAGGQNLVKLNVSDPTDIKLSGSYVNPSSIVDVGSVTGGIAYLAVFSGLQLVDVDSMSGLGSVSMLEGLKVVTYNSYAYLSYVDNARVYVAIIDATDSNAPVNTGVVLTDAYTNIFVEGSTLWVDGHQSFQLYSLTDPANPALFKKYTPVAGSGRVRAVTDARFYVQSVRNQTFDIFDSTVVTSPKWLGSLPMPGKAWVAQIVESKIYAAVGQSFYILRQQGHNTPVVEGTVKAPNESYFYAIAVDGNYAYLLLDFEGLRIIDIRDPSLPVIVGSFNFTPSGSGLTVSGNYVYIADGFHGLRIIDVSDRLNPQQVGQLAAVSYAFNVVVHGDRAYLVDEGIRVIDISDRSNPKEISSYNRGGTSIVLTAAGHLLTAGGQIVELIDITDETALQSLVSFDFGGRTYFAAIHKDRAYVTGEFSESSGPVNNLLQIGIGESSLTPIDSMRLDRLGPVPVAVSDSYLVLSLAESGLMIYANPNAPILDKSVFLPQITK